MPPDIGGAYSTHICHANLTQGSLTCTSCESSGFRHLYEILHRCDVRSLYGRSWQTKTKGFFQTKVSFLLFLCSFVFSPCLFLSHFATTPSKPGISRSSGQTVQMYRPRSSFPGRSFLKPKDFFYKKKVLPACLSLLVLMGASIRAMSHLFKIVFLHEEAQGGFFILHICMI